MFFIPKLELLILSSLFLPNLYLYKIYVAKLFYFLPYTKMYPSILKIYLKKCNRYFFEVMKHVFEEKYIMKIILNSIIFNKSLLFFYKTFMKIYSFMKIILNKLYKEYKELFSSRIFKTIHNLWYF